jgi:hypothetical protein
MTAATIVKEQGNMKECVCLFIATTWLKEVKNSIGENVNPVQ